MAADRAPREVGALEAEDLRPGTGQVERGLPPPEGVARRVRGRVGEHREDERLGVPERVPVVARAGQPLGRDGPSLGPGPGLEDLEQGEPHCLLHLRVAVDLHQSALPEVVEVGPLLGHEAVPAGVVGGGQGGGHLVAEGLP